MARPYVIIPKDINKSSILWNTDNKGRFTKLCAFCDLCFMAEIQDTKDYNRDIDKKRGHIYTSMSYLADRWGWGRQRVKDFLDGLMNEGQLTYLNLSQNRGVDISMPMLLEKPSNE